MGAISPNQLRTEAARHALAGRFKTPEEKSNFYRELGRKSAAGRVVLSADEAEALGAAYRLLSQIAAKLSIEVADDGRTHLDAA